MGAAPGMASLGGIGWTEFLGSGGSLLPDSSGCSSLSPMLPGREAGLLICWGLNCVGECVDDLKRSDVESEDSRAGGAVGSAIAGRLAH